MSDEEINKLRLIELTKHALIRSLICGMNNLNADTYHEQIGSYRLFYNNTVKSYSAAFMEFIDLN